jgi:hypothetical protein
LITFDIFIYVWGGSLIGWPTTTPTTTVPFSFYLFIYFYSTIISPLLFFDKEEGYEIHAVQPSKGKSVHGPSSSSSSSRVPQLCPCTTSTPIEEEEKTNNNNNSNNNERKRGKKTERIRPS